MIITLEEILFIVVTALIIGYYELFRIRSKPHPDPLNNALFRKTIQVMSWDLITKKAITMAMIKTASDSFKKSKSHECVRRPKHDNLQEWKSGNGINATRRCSTS